jgi:peptidoglycan hydrolase-like protein with peptidoglycan-binding domain
LIRASGALVPPANVGPTDAPERVAAGQRALAKLGYGPLKADGIMGPGTRQAIERFERDRRLAVTGELGSRTARELAAQSGLPVE